MTMRLLFTVLVCMVQTISYSQINPCEIDYAILVQSFSYAYEPNIITINTGETVAWINTQGYHDVNGETNSITGENFNNPENFSLPPIYGSTSDPTCIGYYTFTIPGIYHYDCSIQDHATIGMIGTINVVDENTQSVNEVISQSKKKLKVLDYLGREVTHTTNQILFHIYDDGSVEKKFIFE